MIRSFRFDDETNELIERAARETGESPSELVRRSVRQTYGAVSRGAGGSVADAVRRLLPAVGAGRKSPRALAARATKGQLRARDSSAIYADFLTNESMRRGTRSKGRSK
jgi:hypothetical protein